MAPINYDADDTEQHSLPRYNGEESVEGTIEDMLTNLNNQA